MYVTLTRISIVSPEMGNLALMVGQPRDLTGVLSRTGAHLSPPTPTYPRVDTVVAVEKP